ncbi:NAD-binding Rossmann fold oxidoreductase [Panaeolus papilionaceus]|nr:NAD-binding Rossmann fold oxidoreductase [Panaeolus papilionaceus]
MSSPPIKTGFVGLSATGWAATSLGPALLQPSLKDTYKLTAISTSNADSAAAAVDKYTPLAGNTITPYHGSSATIAADENIDLVAISVKAPLHKSVVMPVIEKGKNFFLEWPAGTSLEETEAIRGAAKAKGLKSFVGLQGRTSGVIQRVKQLIDSGAIGRVLSSTFVGVIPSDNRMYAPFHDEHSRYALEASNGVTPLLIAAGHQVDAITHALGPLPSVTASGSQLYPLIRLINKGIETGQTFTSQFFDHFTFSGTLENGTHSTFVMRFGGKMYPGRKTLRWEIEGEEGHILVESESPVGAFMNVASPNLYVNGEKVEIEGVQSGTYDAYATIDDAVRNRKVLDAVEKSAREGTRINLDLKL